jgi:hypothetical protein
MREVHIQLVFSLDWYEAHRRTALNSLFAFTGQRAFDICSGSHNKEKIRMIGERNIMRKWFTFALLVARPHDDCRHGPSYLAENRALPRLDGRGVRPSVVEIIMRSQT